MLDLSLPGMDGLEVLRRMRGRSATAHTPALILTVRWLPLPLPLVLLAINAVLSCLAALDAVKRAYDRSLTASICAIAERIRSLDGETPVDLPYSAFEAFEADAQERIFYAVIGPDGARVTSYDDLSPPVQLPDDGQTVIDATQYRGESLRRSAMKKRLYDPALARRDGLTPGSAERALTRLFMASPIFYTGSGWSPGNGFRGPR